MKVAVLTSSRADYGIYQPLLKAMQADNFFDLRLIVFGTHLSPIHGNTVDQVKADTYVIDHTIAHISDNDTAEAIANNMAVAFKKFSVVWEKEKANYELVICIGDRYEMFAAVSAASPFRLKFAHIHGGETTLGAIDNDYRHCLSVFSSLHFTATEAYAQRVAQIKGSQENIFSVGALSLDNLESLSLLSIHDFKLKFGIDLSVPSLLVTFHPETVREELNASNARELVKALDSFQNYQVIITMPNADTMGNTMREVYRNFAKDRPNIILVENFGTLGYFSCMKWSRVIVGNSSSGIIEAASFQKYVVNIGDRQKGRGVSGNVIHVTNDAVSIIKACKEALIKGDYEGENIYYKKNTAGAIVTQLKKWQK